jgi:thioredoxin 1
MLFRKDIQMAGNIVELTDGDFDKMVIEADVPVLVDFWAPWCGPCRMLAPVIEDVAGQYAGKARFCKINTDDNRESAVEFGISAIPTIILFKNGQIQKKWVGLTAKKDIIAAIDEVL